MIFNPFNINLNKDELENFRSEMLIFFDEKIRENCNYGDVVIKIGRKGAFVFEDLCKGYPLNVSEITFFDFSCFDPQTLKGKNILVFDDSIHTGKTIKKMLSTINDFGSLTVVTILASKDTYENLVNEYPNVRFVSHKILPEIEFLKVYYNFMPAYFDSICIPNLNLIVDKITFSRKLSKEEVVKLFSTELYEPEIIDSSIQFEDRFKMVLEFDEELRKKTYEYAVSNGINFELDQCKVRFFIHILENQTQIYLEYVITPIPTNLTLSNCTGRLNYKYFLCNKEINMRVECFICSVYNVTMYIRSFLRRILESNKLRLNYNSTLKFEPLPWIFNGTLIDSNNFTTTVVEDLSYSAL
ncbi:hypothetical protein FXV91_11785 [Methanosarcina sp. DH2]|jgi:hypoxanthine phosphoribosyltransferase|uniref:phosphoribosyltransferase n=1 Tax=Methanosarcina sp. DH2 TaxID=2605639 RepID=UPI001E3984B9|nr:phosphoribosyltransferase [Methanosarcina sp. DH2]MCC4770834.1 hypothetical protein [Methanosarcina sp. DH2]